MDFQEEHDIDSPQEQDINSLRLSDDNDDDSTQCQFADELLRSRQESSSKGSQRNAPPESSQRDDRQEKRKTKQQSAHDALRDAQVTIDKIKKRKLEGQCPSPPPKFEKKGPVWRFFNVIKVNGKKKTQCKQCPETILSYCGSSTTNMLKHIRKNHQEEHDNLVASGEVKKPTTMTPFVIKTADWKPDGKKTVEWDRKVIRVILSGNFSLATVENPEFRDLLPKEYTPPCRKTLTNKCLTTCYLATKEKLLFDIQSNSNKYIGLQVDHTTASNYDPYCSLCIQYIKDDFSLCSVSLGTFEYKGRHTAEALYNSCEGPGGLVDKYKLHKFNRFYTTDSFSSNVAAFKDSEGIDWLPCMAHVMHNVVKHGIEKCDKVSELHGKMRKILAYCHKSPIYFELIKENARWLGLPDLTLLSECPTRWNSFLKCGQRMVKISEPLNAAMKEAGRHELVLDQLDLMLLEDLIAELEMFDNITNMLCSNTLYTFDNYWPMKVLIEETLALDVDVGKTVDHINIKEFRGFMKSHFAKFKLSEKTENFAKTAALLSPIHMIKAQEDDLMPFIDRVVKIIESDIPQGCENDTQMVGPSQDLVNLDINLSRASGSGHVSPQKPKSKYALLLNPKYNVGAKKQKPHHQTKVHSSLREIVTTEVMSYHGFAVASSRELFDQVDNGGFDVSKWWFQHHEKYPKLALVVKNLLAIPATSANCERAFSSLTDIVTKKRNRLHGKTTEKLTFCKHNLSLIPDYTTNKGETQTETENTSDVDEWF